MRLLRHLLAIAALPFVVTVVVPIWIARADGIVPALGTNATELALQIAGVGMLAIGLMLFAASLRRFATDGQGTLAPWDPPRSLVVRGPYRYVRNPMISGVVFILFGEALVLLSASHAWWAAIFLLLNFVQIPLFEEPQLRRRFGGEYAHYARHVPRLVPRLRPWIPTPAARPTRNSR
jgi:protein-S-isoprenylcysteine O-methyltransferase Ste14